MAMEWKDYKNAHDLVESRATSEQMLELLLHCKEIHYETASSIEQLCEISDEIRTAYRSKLRRMESAFRYALSVNRRARCVVGFFSCKDMSHPIMSAEILNSEKTHRWVPFYFISS